MSMTNLFSTIVLVGQWGYIFVKGVFASLPKPLSPEQYNYYVAELAFYLSLMFSQFTDIKRKVSQHCLGGTSLLPLNSPPQTLHILFISEMFCLLFIHLFFFPLSISLAMC